jgi:S-adenosylmethionine decarboxylase
MFYEGAEKRLAICVSNIDLFDYPASFWVALVAEAGASILSKTEKSDLKSFLLSESSLFVWRDQILLITCGETELIKSAQYFIKQIKQENIKDLFFQRHQLIRPETQKSDSQQDNQRLRCLMTGYCEAAPIFICPKTYQGDQLLLVQKKNETSLMSNELLMLHHITGNFAEQLQRGVIDKMQIFDRLKLSQYFPRFEVDHFAFQPKGYSINGILNQDYFTLHITPEKLTAYVSFESSLPAAQTEPFRRYLLKLFTPKRECLGHFKLKA